MQPSVTDTCPVGRGSENEAGGLRLSLVIPAHNQKDAICQTIQRAASVLSTLTAEYEILVIDDGSTDGTADLVSAEQVGPTGNPRVRLLRHSHRRGYGA